MQLRTQGKCFATLPNRFDYFGPDGPIAVIATRLASPLSTFRRALLYFYPDRWLVAGLLGLTCLGTLLGLLQVWPLAWLVDGVLAQRQLSWWPDAWSGTNGETGLVQIVFLALLTILLRVASELCSLLRNLLNIRIGNGGVMRVRTALFQKFQRLSLEYHRSQPLGDSIYRLSNDATGCQNMLNVALDLAVATMTLVIMLGIMLSRSLLLTGVAVSVAPLLLLTNLYFGRRLKSRTVHARETDSRFTTVLQRSLATIGLTQAFNREDSELDRFRRSARGSLDAWFWFHWEAACYRLWVGVIFAVGSGLIFGLGAWMIHHGATQPAGGRTMTVGDLVVFLAYLGMFYDPLCKISGAGAGLHDALTAVRRVFELLDRDPIVQDAPHARPLPLQSRTLALDRVTFRYDGNRPVLQDVSVDIRPGEFVAFVGSSGVGKSTLLNLLPRFFDPQKGAVRLDGIDARDILLRDLRRHVALVLQESVLLPTTIAENIAYGSPHASPDEIEAAACLAGIDEFIQSLPNGYGTEIAESGQNLSGGQRQRIAIARALLTGAPILVLDEPTSSLDPQHEQLITETLRQLKGQRTIVLVSHRLSTVIDCDRVFVLKQGAIAEHGTHQELLSRRGAYYELARHQLKLDEGHAVHAA